jgi:hypothetical protein
VSDATFKGYFWAMRGVSLEVIKANPLAFILAYIIAERSRYTTDFNVHNLAIGEALLGDHGNYGMTEQQYRTAKAQLEKWKFATFRATNKGTIGKLTDTRLFSVLPASGNDQADTQPTDAQRTPNGRVTTNEERKNDKEPERAISDRLARNFKVGSEEPSNRAGDWQSLTVTQKAQQILGATELALKDQRWQKRINLAPTAVEEILDKMHADIAEGSIIKNRGGYAEQLWKVTK